MTDRRNRPIVRCSVTSCVSAGHWQSSRGLCPVHYAELIEQTRAAIHRHRHPEPDPASSAGGFLSDHLGILAMPSRTPAPPGAGHTTVNIETPERGRP